MSPTSQILDYLIKTAQSKSIFQGQEIAECLAEAVKLRSKLATQGGPIVLPALETTELWCKQRVLLMPTLPVAREALTQRAIKAGVEGTTELVAEIGRDAEKTLILALDHPSSYVRLQAAALLGLGSVMSKNSVQPLKRVLEKGTELEMVEIVAVASLLMNSDTDRATRDELSRFLAYWIDNRASALESGKEKQPGQPLDSSPARVYSLIPRILLLMAASEQQKPVS
jgi:hypothetical protein